MLKRLWGNAYRPVLSEICKLVTATNENRMEVPLKGKN